MVNDSYKGLDVKETTKIEVVMEDPDRKEHEYHDEDVKLVKDIKQQEQEDNDGEDTTAEDSDPEKPELEFEKDELIRRLKRSNLTKASESLDKEIENFKEKFFGKTLENVQAENPFVPAVFKTRTQREEEKKAS